MFQMCLISGSLETVNSANLLPVVVHLSGADLEMPWAVVVVVVASVSDA